MYYLYILGWILHTKNMLLKEMLGKTSIL